MRVEIRRYKNKKLFEPIRKKFLTLRQIRNLVVVGNELQVLDTQTNEDVTVLVLAQVMAHETPEGNKDIDQALVKMIREDIPKKAEVIIELIRTMHPKKSLSEARTNASRQFSLT